MQIKSIQSATNLYGKKVLVRTDFNVPIKSGKIQDMFKITQQLETVDFLLKNHCRIILVTHLGRPKPGKFDKKYSVELIANALSKILNRKIVVVKELSEFEAGTKISRARFGDIIMLENIRFADGEEKNSTKFAKSLAKLADIYVNDAFAVSHRAHASVEAIKKYLPSYAGILLAKEIANLNKAFHPKKPLINIIGGSKIGTKIGLIKNLHQQSNYILVGGALANNFLLARGLEVGKSMIDKDSIVFAKKFKSKKIILPVDVITLSKVKKINEVRVKKVKEVGKNDFIYDIGPETIRIYAHFIKKAATIIWNGPLGMFEDRRFKHGTLALARVIAAKSKGPAFGLVGGGETVEALKMTGMFDYVDWVSTGGGAMLSYLGKEPMPGLKGLIKK